MKFDQWDKLRDPVFRVALINYIKDNRTTINKVRLLMGITNSETLRTFLFEGAGISPLTRGRIIEFLDKLPH